MSDYTSKVYILLGAKGLVVRCEGGYTVENIQNYDQWMCVDEGVGDKYNHCQGMYFPKFIIDERGIYRYMAAPAAEWPEREALHRFEYEGVEWAIYERTQEEMDADYTPPAAVPDGSMEILVAEVAALKESNAQLQEALDLLLSGEVE